MFEGLVADILSDALGDVLEGLDKEKLSISVWGGDVVLTRLKVKASFFEDLALPFALSYGIVGKLVLKADWKNLKNKPVIAELEDVFVVLVPKDSSSYDEEKEKEKAHADKVAKLQAWEDHKDASRATKDDKEPEEVDNFGSRLVQTILDNVQVNVNKIHLRYEDSVPGSGRKRTDRPVYHPGPKTLFQALTALFTAVKETSYAADTHTDDAMKSALLAASAVAQVVAEYLARHVDAPGAALRRERLEAFESGADKLVGVVENLLAKVKALAPADEENYLPMAKCVAKAAAVLSQAATSAVTMPSSANRANTLAKACIALANTIMDMAERAATTASTTADPQNTFAAGVTIERLVAQSCDGDWKPAFLKNPPDKLARKLVDLRNLSIYWDPHATPVAGLPDAEVEAALQELMPRDDSPARSHHYVVAPINLGARVTVNNAAKPNLLVPKVHVEAILESLAVRLDEDQYKDLMTLGNMVSYYNKSYPYRKHRPAVPVKGNARTWWKFAIQCHVDIIKERSRCYTSAYYAERRTRKLAYKELWTKRCKARKKKLNKTDQVLLDDMQKELSFEDIRFFRTVAEVELKKQKIKIDNTPKKGWFGKKKNKQEQEEEDEGSAIEMSAEQRAFLHEAIGYDENEKVDTGPTPREYVFAKVDFKLLSASISLASAVPWASCSPTAHGHDLVHIEASGMSLNVLQRTDSLKVDVNLQSLTLTDQYSPYTLYPVFVQPRVEDATNSNFFTLSYEQNPLDQRADMALDLKAYPLSVVYNPALIARLGEFFVDEENKAAAEDLALLYQEQMNSLREASVASVAMAIENRTTMDIHVDIAAPHIIVPETCVSRAASFLVADLGRLTVASSLSPTKDTDNVAGVAENDLYDHYNVRLHNIQLFLACGYDEYDAAKSKRFTEYHLLEGVDIDLNVASCIIPNSLTLTGTKVTGELPLLALHVSSRKVRRLMAVLAGIQPETAPAANADHEDMSVVGGDTLLSTRDIVKDIEANVKLEEEAIPDVNAVAKRKTLALDFTVKKVLLEITNDMGDEHVCVAMLTAENITAAVAQRSFDLDVKLLLGSLNVEAKDKTRADEFKYLVHSKAGDDLIALNVFVAQPDCAVFTTLHNSTATTVSGRFGDLGVTVNHEAIVSALQWYHAAMPKKEAIYDEEEERARRIKELWGKLRQHVLKGKTVLRADWLDLVRHAVKTADTAAARAEKARRVAKRRRTKWLARQQTHRDEQGLDTTVALDLIDVKVNATVERISIAIDRPGAHLAAVGLGDVDLAFLERPLAMDVQATLASLFVQDLTPEGEKYSTVLTIVEGDATRAEYETFDATEEDYPGHDMRVLLKTSAINVVFLNRFVLDLMNYGNNEAQQMIDAANGGATIKSAKTDEDEANDGKKPPELAVEPDAPPPKIKLDVEVHAPCIVVPRSSTSDEVLVIDLGLLDVKNNITTVNQSVAPLDSMSVKLTNLRVARAEQGLAGGRSAPILADADVDVKIQRVLDPEEHSVPAILIKGDLPSVDVRLVRPDYAFLIAIGEENMNEKPTSMADSVEVVEVVEEDHEDLVDLVEWETEQVDERPLLAPKRNPITHVSSAAAGKASKKNKRALRTRRLPFSMRWTALDANFHIGTVGLKLIGGGLEGDPVLTPEDKKDPALRAMYGDPCELLVLKIDGVDVGAVQYSDSALDAKVEVTSVDIIDARDTKSVYRQILGREDPTKTMLSVIFAQDRKGNKDIDVAVSKLQGVLALEIVNVLKAYTLLPKSEEVVSLEDGELDLIDGAEVVAEQIEPKGPPAAPTKVVLRARVDGVSLAIVEQAEDADSRAFTTDFDADISFNQELSGEMRAFANVPALAVTRCFMSKRTETTSTLVSPFCITSDFSLLLGKDDYKRETTDTNAVVDVAPIDVYVSYHDVELALAMAEVVAPPRALLPPPSEAADALAAAQKRATEREASGESVVLSEGQRAAAMKALAMEDGEHSEEGEGEGEEGSDDEEAFEGKGKGPAGEEEEDELPPVEHRERARALLSRVRVIVIDDQHLNHQVPLLDVRLKEVLITAKEWSHEAKINAQAMMEGEYWNTKINLWEPMIEPWDVHANALVMLEPSFAFTSGVGSTEVLNMNVTHALVENLAMTSMLLQQEHKALRDRAAWKPYRLINRTGLPLEFSPMDEDGQVALKLEAVDGEVVDYDGFGPPPNLQLGGHDSAPPTNHRVKLKLMGFAEIPSVRVDRVGDYAFKLHGGETIGEEQQVVVCTVSQDKDVKVLLVHSSLWINNATRDPMEIILHERNLPDSILDTMLLPPFDEMPVPVKIAADAHVRVRPLVDDVELLPAPTSMHWRSREETNMKRKKRLKSAYKEQDAYYVLKCTDRDEKPEKKKGGFFKKKKKEEEGEPSGPTYMLGALMTRHKTPRTVFRHTITIHPRVVLENALSETMHYEVVDESGGEPVTGSLEPGGEIPLNHIDTSQHIKFKAWFGEHTCPDPSTLFNPATITLPGQGKQDAITLMDKAGLALKLEIMRTTEMSGTRRVIVFAPYWLMNHTGLPVIVGQHVGSGKAGKQVLAAGQSEDGIPPLEDVPFMFSFSKWDMFANTGAIKIGSSKWSKPLSFDRIGTNGVIEVEGTEEVNGVKMRHEIGVAVKQGVHAERLVKVVTFAPRFLLFNNMKSRQLTMTLADEGHGSPTIIASEESASFHSVVGAKSHLVTVGIEGEPEWGQCGKFPLDQEGLFTIKLHKGDEVCFIDGEIKQDGPSTLVLFEESTGVTPFRVENASRENIKFFQKGLDERSSMLKGVSSSPYAWDEPTGELRLVCKVRDVEQDYPLTELMTFAPLKLAKGDELLVDVYADGITRVLRFRHMVDYIAEKAKKNKHKKKSRAKRIAKLGVFQGAKRTALGRRIAQKNRNRKRPKGVKNLRDRGLAKGEVSQGKVMVKLKGLGLSVIDQLPQEVIYVEVEGIDAWISDTNLQLTMEMKLQKVQIDNQLTRCQFPVVLAPCVDSIKEGKDMVHLSVVKEKGHEPTVFYTYAGVLVQELDLQVDERLLMALLDFGTSIPTVLESPETQTRRTRKPSRARSYHINGPAPVVLDGEPLPARSPDEASEEVTPIPKLRPRLSRTRQIYCQLLVLNPIKVNVTFMDSYEMDAEALHRMRKLLAGFKIPNIDCAPLKINALLLEHPFGTQNELARRIAKHYTMQGVSEAYKIAGSISALGNPVGLFGSLATGVGDLFFEPAKGAVEGPEAFARGLAKGTTSFAKNTVYGLGDTTEKILGAVGAGLSKLAMDEEYQRNRRKMERRKAKHAGDGALLGMKTFGMAAGSAVTGLVKQPVKGAREDGARGFVKGIAKGTIGAGAKLAGGVVDGMSKAAEGVKNTTTMFEDVVPRARLPRYYEPLDGPLPLYDGRAALGQYVLWECKEGKYSNTDRYLHHVDVGDRILILATRAVVLVNPDNGNVTWAKNHSAVTEITRDGPMITLTLNPDSTFAKLRRTKAVSVTIPSLEHAQIFFDKLGSARTALQVFIDEEEELEDEVV